MAETARVNGLIGSVGLKAPVRVATTANIALSGTPMVDDVSLVSGDRVLVKDQTTASENGIYEVDAGAWTRVPDFDGARDIVTGTAVNVNSGTVNAVTQWRVTNTGKITPGTTALVFARSATAFGEDLAATIHAAPNKATPIDADEFGIWNSVTGLLARVSWVNVKATLKAYFDTLYQALGNYAALAGSASQVFSVGTATAAAHALRAGQYGSQINGWTYANNGADAANDLDIAAGSGLDSTRAYFISCAAMTKQSDVAWAAGTNAGLLDTGAVGNNDYYLFSIARSDTGATDYISSLSNTTPSLAANWDYFRLIGWFKRVGGTIVAFHTYETEGGGLELLWDVPTLDVSLANTLTTSRRTDAIKVPLNFSVVAHFNLRVFDATNAFQIWICCPDQTDAAPSATAGPLTNGVSNTNYAFEEQMHIRTSATGTIAARADLATVDDYKISTMGFTWARRV